MSTKYTCAWGGYFQNGNSSSYCGSIIRACVGAGLFNVAYEVGGFAYNADIVKLGVLVL